MNAWLLTWEGTAGPALVPDKKIVAILSSRRSSKTVADIVDTMYCRNVDTAYEMALLANNRKLREHQYSHLGYTSHRFCYGRNPCIFARVVSDLKVERDEVQRTELIRWTELPVYKNAKSGSIPIQTEPACDHQLIRSLGPLSFEIYESKAKAI